MKTPIKRAEASLLVYSELDEVKSEKIKGGVWVLGTVLVR